MRKSIPSQIHSDFDSGEEIKPLLLFVPKDRVHTASSSARVSLHTHRESVVMDITGFFRCGFLAEHVIYRVRHPAKKDARFGGGDRWAAGARVISGRDGKTAQTQLLPLSFEVPGEAQS